MIRITFACVSALLVMHIGPVQAHVASVSTAQHAAEHAWLALLLLPVAAVGLRLLRRRC